MKTQSRISKKGDVAHKGICPGGIGGLLVMMVLSTAFAQMQEPPVTQPLQDLPLRASEIPGRAETVRAEIREMLATSRQSRQTAEITERLSELEAELSELGSQTASLTAGQLNPQWLPVLEGSWSRLELRLNRWRRTLDEKALADQVRLDRLRQLEQVWQETRDQAVQATDDQAANAVVERITQTLSLLTDARGEINNHLAETLSLQGQVIDGTARVEQSLAQVADARQRAQSALITPGQAPLWRIFDETGQPSPGQDSSLFLGEIGHDLRLFFRDNQARLVFHVLLFIPLILMMLRLRAVCRIEAARDGSLDRPALVLEHPFSAALFLWLLAVRWVTIQPSEVVLQILTLLMSIPLIALLHSKVEHFRKTFYGLALLLFMSLLSALLPRQIQLARFLNLGFTSLGLASLALQLKPGHHVWAGLEERTRKAARILTQIAATLLGFALLANVIGSVSLALFLTRAVFLSAYAGLLFIIAFLLLDALILVGLNRVMAGWLQSIRLHSRTLQRNLRRWLQIGFLIWWVHATLIAFEIRTPVIASLSEFLTRQWSVGNLSISIGGLLIFVLTIWVSVLLSRIIRIVLEEDVLNRMTLPRGMEATISMMAGYGTITLGLLAAASAAGFGLSQLTIIAGALGVGIGFGLQEVVNNFVSGLILAFERPIRIGDWIEFKSLYGTVTRIGIRSSIIRTSEGADVTVPNGQLLANELTNWTLSDQMRRVTIPVGVAYGTDPAQVLEILQKTLSQNPQVASTPEPESLFIGFGASSLDFEVRFWTPESRLQVKSAVLVLLNQNLTEAGIEIPFPQSDVHLRSVSADFPDPLPSLRNKSRNPG